LDGKTPTANSTLYNGAFTLTGAGAETLKALSIGPAGKVSKTVSVKFTVKMPVNNVEVTSPAVSAYGTTYQFKATVSPANASNKALKWEFADKTAATAAGFKITDAGKLTIPAYSAARPGSIDVKATAKDGYGYYTTFTLNLINGITGLTGQDLNLTAGKSVTLKPGYTPANALSAFKAVSWEITGVTGGDSSDANTYITLTQKTGAVKAKTFSGPAPTVTIKATSTTNTGVSALFNITVYPAAVTKIQMTPTKATLFVTADLPQCPKTMTLTPTVTAKTGALTDLVWTSSNSSIATVDAGGVVTAIKAGKATITASAVDGSGKKATCAVTVNNTITSITINAPAMGLTLLSKKSMQLTAAVNSDATDKSVVWSSSDTSLATVSKTGKVTAKAVSLTGMSVTITAQSKSNPGVSAAKTINLNPTAPTLKWNGTAPAATVRLYTINLGSGENTCAYTAGATVSGIGVYYTTSNSAIATINQATGAVTAVKAGTVTITAAAADYSGKKLTYKVQVIIPAGGVTVGPKTPGVYTHPGNGYSSNPIQRVAFGKSATFVATPFSVYGKPSESKMTWSVEQGRASNLAWSTSAKDIKISASGVLTINKNIQYYNMPFLVRATTTDGTNKTATFEVLIVWPDSNLKFASKPVKIGNTTTSNGSKAYYLDFYYQCGDSSDMSTYEYNAHEDFLITYSNTKVLVPWGYGYYDTYGRNHDIMLIFETIAKGSCTITVKSYSTGVSKSFTVKVT